MPLWAAGVVVLLAAAGIIFLLFLWKKTGKRLWLITACVTAALITAALCYIALALLLLSAIAFM